MLKKLKEFSKKNQGFEKELGVLDAICLRLPPKNRAKKGPGKDSAFTSLYNFNFIIFNFIAKA